MSVRAAVRQLPGAVLVVLLFAPGCSSTPRVERPELDFPVDRPTVVLVPGITGVELRCAEGGKRVWGGGRNLLWPRDGGRPLELGLGTVDGIEPSPLEPGEVIQEIRLAGLVGKPIYGPVIELLERHGWTSGDLEDPAVGDTLFQFAYDWRQDNVASAQLLDRRLAAAAAATGAKRPRIVLLCQSNGAYLCRWVARYGGASLEEVEAGEARPPERYVVEKIVFVGTANGGSLRILRFLDRGRRYLGFYGRRWSARTVSTFRSLFQDLPAYREDLFVDELGRPLEVDLWSVASWQRYGWSVLRDSAKISAEEREAFVRFFAEALDRGRRLQLALHRPGEPLATRYYLIQNRDLPTPQRAALVEIGEGWQLWMADDRQVKRRPDLQAVLEGDGDGHASSSSQRFLSAPELSALAGEFSVGGKHFEMILEPATQRYLLEVLAEQP